MKKILVPSRFILVFSTFLFTVLLFVDRACISVAKEGICSDLGFGMTDFGWIMAIFTLGYALFQTPVGKLADMKGARRVIAGIVTIWSFLTTLTGFAWNFVSMLVIRFLFGAGEAGAFPALSKVVYHWFPIRERGIIQGINFSGARIGAAFAMPMVAWLILEIGWRHTFMVFGAFGILYGIFWFLLFRNKPEDALFISSTEVDYIVKNRQKSGPEAKKTLRFSSILKSRVMWKTMVQFISTNFTFYFVLTWMYPYIQERFQLGLVEAGFYTSIPLLAGAFGNLLGGLLIDAIYRRGKWKASRRWPASIGFALSALGMIMVTQVSSPLLAVLFVSMGILGVDMTLSPSFAFCIDIGKENAGIVTGTMNMAGNLGAFVTIIAFPYLYEWTNHYEPFFMIAAGLNLLAIVMWATMNPEESIPNGVKKIIT